MKNKKPLYVIIVILAMASIFWRILEYSHLEQTSLLFVGIPTFITLLVIKYSNTPKSAYGVAFKTLTLFLLMCSILFGEGLICIIIMSPIFYGITALVIYIISLLKNKDSVNSYIAIPAILILFSPTDLIQPNEVFDIQTRKIIHQNNSINRLNENLDLSKNIPVFFKTGFPMPTKIEGEGLNINDFRKIYFKSNTKGVGVLHLKIKDKTKNSITYTVISDSTHINHWLTWKEIKVTITPNTNKTKTIIWNTKFSCDLGPSWYFEYLEKYAVEQMNQHLINSYFKP